MIHRTYINRTILFVLLGMLFLFSITYMGIKILIPKAPIQQALAVIEKPSVSAKYEIEDNAISLSKKFAISYFDGTAFTHYQDQPVVESYKQYLQNTEALYVKSGQSPLGGKVLSFGKEIFIPEPEQNPISYAVWIVTTIETRFGEKKGIVFITRVSPQGDGLVIVTAGAIPYQE